MRIFTGILCLTAAAWAFQVEQLLPPAFQDFTHYSQVMGSPRGYRVMLPSAYKESTKRYPVLYWIRGPEQLDPQRDSELSRYVAGHDLIVVDVGPVQINSPFALYFPELVEQVDRTLRTVADRSHRAVTGVSSGGFLAYWLAGKYPDVLSSASSFKGLPEAFVGPQGFTVEYDHEDLFNNYEGVRTLLVEGEHDYLSFYHRRLDAIWSNARANHESQTFDAEHSSPDIAKTLDFHMAAFADPLPKPAAFNHADVYPNFTVWGWEVTSDRRQPGYTVMEHVSPTGFRSAVRQWIPGGATVPEVKLWIGSPPVYPHGGTVAVTYLRLRDGSLRHVLQKADGDGRLSFELDGGAWEVGISNGSDVTVSDYQILDAGWATAGEPVKLKVKLWNKGSAVSANAIVHWESSNAGVKFAPPESRLPGLTPGESTELQVTVTVADPSRAFVRLFAVTGNRRMPIDVPLYPAAIATKDFQIADGRSFTVYEHAVQKSKVALGQGNGDGFAAPGESFVVLLPDGDSWRAAELFTNSPCVDNSQRASDSWSDYDQAGSSVKYSIPSIRGECEPGTVIHMLARVMIPHAPDHQVKYWALEFPVWYRNEVK